MFLEEPLHTYYKKLYKTKMDINILIVNQQHYLLRPTDQPIDQIVITFQNPQQKIFLRKFMK